jgi:hypothetical protein
MLRRANCAEMAKAELDLVMLGQLAASEVATHAAQRARSTFHFQGRRVCKLSSMG